MILLGPIFETSYWCGENFDIVGLHIRRTRGLIHTGQTPVTWPGMKTPPTFGYLPSGRWGFTAVSPYPEYAEMGF